MSRKYKTSEVAKIIGVHPNTICAVGITRRTVAKWLKKKSES